MTLEWTDQDSRAVDTARILAADAVEKVGNGHPGTPISLAPVAYLLYQKVMNTDPTDDLWLGRDRFVLSAGHASLTQYTQLYLGGMGLELDDIKALRTWGSRTPGHPEYHHTKFVECTTGPLGAGISNAVGMAMAARRERGLFDPEAPEGESVFDRQVYVIAGDGCLQEGISSEASSLAATQNLGNLTMIYDDNRITIEGETDISFTEDVSARYEAYGWHVAHVDWTNGGTEYREDMDALYAAIEEAKAVTDKPSFIKLTTVIGWPLPNKQGMHAVHGSKIGGDEIAAMKELLKFPQEPFAIDTDIVDYARRNAAERGRAARAAWDEKYQAWRDANPERAALLDRAAARKLPEDLSLPVFEEGKKSTRAASGEVLSALASQLPELWGGSADLAGSNNTTMKGEPSFLPTERATHDWPGNPYGRTLHFGIREHAMGGILNGINLSGLTRAYGGTFLVFADYMRPAVRLAAIMGVPTVFVWSHDSVGVGEDGPTHQPIEHLASLRAIPGVDIVRPADANETSVAWGEILRRTERPSGIILSRQDLRTIPRGEKYASAEGVANGGYVVSEADGDATVILIASGSEVALALDAQDALQAEGIATRVVSMPCQEWFDEQPEEYRESVLPAAVTARVSIEAGIAMGWSKYVGPKGASVSIEHFGASASGNKCFEEFGFTVDNVVATAKSVL
ncbi:transketolase [Tessaracoccus lapidicaptus]|uniref:Transketolase n=1 Tax=Tessaracoccus lapidicaptus TaxID=1427523 RepID=A0A1C0AQ90_9ACTN|nr:MULTISPECIES: transketolase [Tessaracoccus]AQX15268.1 transketolase [Tessaracoccus sp. T2.5-30]OCL36420.1 transketolase [Tessaracoccus lapidicaptus]VEP39530.1 Transketolase [Tessaracoccus lapidicaptus]